MLENVLFPNL